MARRYDIVILGRGAAAFSAAIKASELSEGRASIAMIGTGPIGGTCVNVGCVPSKYLLEASHRYFYPKRANFPGISTANPRVEFKELMRGLRGLVSNFRKSKYEQILESYPNVDVIEGKGSFLSPTQIKVNDGNSKIIDGKNVIIATGSRPTAPPIEGLSNVGYITSDTVWNLDSKPESLAVIGGGAIGLELGQAFLHLGTEVTIVEAMPRIVPQAEPQISEMLQRAMQSEGMNFFVKARINRAFKRNGKKVLEVVTAKGKEELSCDEILVATGRAPNTQDLNLESAMVEHDSRGFIKTDLTMRTSNPKVYAAGDCVSKRFMLETLAAREGVVAASNIMGSRIKIDYLSTPWAVFTVPQIASVGYTEEEFVKKTGSCSCRTISLSDVPKAVMLGESDGLIKLVIDPNSDKVVGLHILSPFATEFIIEGVYAIRYGLKYTDIVDTTHIFPTLSEGIKLSAQAFLRDVARMSCCVE